MREYILKGKDTAALEATVRQRPDDPLAQYYLAKRYYLENRFSDAQSAYAEAVRLDPENARAHLGLGLSLYELGKFPEAESEFEQTLHFDPKSAWAEYMLGTIAWFEGRVVDAIPHMQRAAKLDPRSDPASYGLAACYIQRHRYSEAMDALRQAIGRRGDYPRYHTALGEVLVYLDKVDAGRREYERALQLDPNYGPACGLMGGLYVNKLPGPDSQRKAEELLLKATHHNTYRPQQVYLDLGNLYLQEGRYQEALDALRTSIRLDPRDEEPYYSVVKVYRRLGNRPAEAAALKRFQQVSELRVQRDSLEAAVVHDPHNPAARLSLARVYRRSDLMDSAVEQYSEYLRLRPGDTAAARELEQLKAENRAAAAAGNFHDLIFSPLRAGPDADSRRPPLK